MEVVFRLSMGSMRAKPFRLSMHEGQQDISSRATALLRTWKLDNTAAVEHSRTRTVESSNEHQL
jgi:hypothetical protein